MQAFLNAAGSSHVGGANVTVSSRSMDDGAPPVSVAKEAAGGDVSRVTRISFFDAATLPATSVACPVITYMLSPAPMVSVAVDSPDFMSGSEVMLMEDEGIAVCRETSTMPSFVASVTLMEVWRVIIMMSPSVALRRTVPDGIELGVVLVVVVVVVSCSRLFS